MFKIFIGDDAAHPEVAQVAAYSIRKNSSIEVDINFLNLKEIKKKTKESQKKTKFEVKKMNL